MELKRKCGNCRSCIKECNIEDQSEYPFYYGLLENQSGCHIKISIMTVVFLRLLTVLRFLSTANDASLDFFETLRRRYPEAYPLLYTDLIIDFLFMIDILMNFRTTYVKEGEVLITNPWKIAVHYLKTYFVVDFVAAIPWDLLASFNSGTEEVSAKSAKLNVLT